MKYGLSPGELAEFADTFDDEEIERLHNLFHSYGSELSAEQLHDALQQIQLEDVEGDVPSGQMCCSMSSFFVDVQLVGRFFE